jgi:Methylamine utilisation protein MauE
LTRWLGEALRWFFVWLLAASAIGKLADMDGFQEIVRTYRILPSTWVPMVSWLLAFTEALLSSALAFAPTILSRFGRAARLTVLLQGRFAAVFGLHLLYMAWLTRALIAGHSIPNCGCFGVYWARPLSIYTVVEDLVLLIMAGWLWWARTRARADILPEA